MHRGDTKKIVIIGAGPAGLTAAFEACKSGEAPLILEADGQVGGISRTVLRDGWRFDIGGHRFFTKVKRVRDLWSEMLPPEDFLTRPRLSRIYYQGKFYDYPLRAMNALRNLGILEALFCVLSYVKVRITPPKDQSNFEGWVAARFGWRLYRTFFKTYTEKVWGIAATDLQAEWAAQRIKNLSLLKAITNSLMPKGRNSTEVTSLIEQFQYPKFGPGMLWESCAEIVESKGAELKLNTVVKSIKANGDGTIQVNTGENSFTAEHCISSMPINKLVEILDPPAPSHILNAAKNLKHRDFMTVALVINNLKVFPDNWIYIHDPKVQVGRIQNFGSWSPYMVHDGKSCLGLEYFVNEGDELWNSTDEVVLVKAKAELASLNLVPTGDISDGWVVRVPKAYPVYDSEYSEALEDIRKYLVDEWPQIYPVGRNGMHRYNNQDHSMMTAALTIENILTGAQNDVWQVNVENEYHEEESAHVGVGGTGRSAPIIGANSSKSEK
jgi:protoporphyrinogen oxidase